MTRLQRPHKFFVPGSLVLVRQSRTAWYRTRIKQAMLLTLDKRLSKAPKRVRKGLIPKGMLPAPLHTLGAVLDRVTLLTPAEIERSMGPVELAVKEAYAGRLSYASFVMLHTSLCFSFELEKHSGVRGLSELLKAAFHASEDIQKRCNQNGKWKVSACKGTELNALSDFASAHHFQLSNCTRKEIADTAERLNKKISQGRLQDVSKTFDLAETLNQMRNDLHDVKVNIPVLREVK